MTITINPEITKIKVRIPEGFAVLHLRTLSSEQSQGFRQKLLSIGRKRDTSGFLEKLDQLRRELVDSALIDVSAQDEDGNPDEFVFIDSQGKSIPLDNQIENWKSYIPEDVKNVAGSMLVQEEAAYENSKLKN